MGGIENGISKANLYAYAYYSGVEYEENIWLKKLHMKKAKSVFQPKYMLLTLMENIAKQKEKLQ